MVLDGRSHNLIMYLIRASIFLLVTAHFNDDYCMQHWKQLALVRRDYKENIHMQLNLLPTVYV